MRFNEQDMHTHCVAPRSFWQCIRLVRAVSLQICAKMTGSAGDSPGGGFATILFISRHHADLYSAGWSVAHPRIFNYTLR